MTHLWYYIDLAFDVYETILIIRILMSWFRPDPYHPVVRFIHDITDPFLAPFQRAIPPLGMVDISPIVAFFVLGLIKKILYGFIF